MLHVSKLLSCWLLIKGKRTLKSSAWSKEFCCLRGFLVWTIKQPKPQGLNCRAWAEDGRGMLDSTSCAGEAGWWPCCSLQELWACGAGATSELAWLILQLQSCWQRLLWIWGSSGNSFSGERYRAALLGSTLAACVGCELLSAMAELPSLPGLSRQKWE